MWQTWVIQMLVIRGMHSHSYCVVYHLNHKTVLVFFSHELVGILIYTTLCTSTLQLNSAPPHIYHNNQPSHNPCLWLKLNRTKPHYWIGGNIVQHLNLTILQVPPPPQWEYSCYLSNSVTRRCYHIPVYL